MLDEILEYHETPEDDNFVAGVMNNVRRQQRIRRLILTVTGMTGAVFGTTGVLTISSSISQLMNDANMLPVSLTLVGVAVFLAWLFQDEVLATG